MLGDARCVQARPNQGKVLGHPSFQRRIEKLIGPSVSLTPVGRTRKATDALEKTEN